MYRDVAIWYDEFLTPGENFNEIIGKELEKSDLISLLVTPNFVNEDKYVQKVENPEALRSGKSILPAEMVEPDRDELNQKYGEIPNPLDAHKETELDQGMREALNIPALTYYELGNFEKASELRKKLGNKLIFYTKQGGNTSNEQDE